MATHQHQSPKPDPTNPSMDHLQKAESTPYSNTIWNSIHWRNTTTPIALPDCVPVSGCTHDMTGWFLVSEPDCHNYANNILWKCIIHPECRCTTNPLLNVNCILMCVIGNANCTMDPHSQENYLHLWSCMITQSADTKLLYSTNIHAHTVITKNTALCHHIIVQGTRSGGSGVRSQT